MNKQLRSYCFTLNNYTPEQYAAFKQKVPSQCKYAIAGEEIGEEEKTEHLQGYVQLTSRKTFNTIKKWWAEEILAQPHIEPAKGTAAQNFTYCSKDGKFWEHGARPKQGKRNDIEAFMNAVESGLSDVQLIRDFPNEWTKYNKAADKARKAFKKEKAIEGLQTIYKEVELKPWQSTVIEHIKNQTCRTITWVYDKEGNKGKTFLAMYLISLGSVYYVEGGKKADIAYGYNDEDLVIFDFTREQEGFINYSAMESFKNGIMFSPKYESGSRIFGPAKVLCLSNFEPKCDRLSEDRWDIINISNNQQNKSRPSIRISTSCAECECEKDKVSNNCNCFCHL